MKVIAHRGAVNECLENSASAFERAIEVGADRLELDVQFTKDMELVVMHDVSLLRTANVDKRLEDITRAKLQQYKLKNGDAILLLDEVIDNYLNRIEINIEIKGNNPKLGEAVAYRYRSHPLREKIIVSSFEAAPLIAVRDHSDLTIACLLSSPASWPLSSLSLPLNFVQHVGASIIHPNTRLLNDNFMDQAITRGWTVYTYSELNGSEEEHDPDRLWTSLSAWGVAGHCTNYPRQLRNWVDKVYGFETIHKEAEQQMDG